MGIGRPRSVEATEGPVNKNIEKGRSFAWAFKRMKDAHEAGYYIEAAAIAESIISDRIHSVLLAKGEKLPVAKDGFPNFATLIKAVGRHLHGTEGFTVEELDGFRENRNTAIHQVAKSQPGDPTLPIEDFLEKAKVAASDGTRLARKIVEWYRKGLPREIKAAKRKRSK